MSRGFHQGKGLNLARREFVVFESLLRRAGRTVQQHVMEQNIQGVDDEI
jgi:DNA-binding response OmpR family regulator